MAAKKKEFSPEELFSEWRAHLGEKNSGYVSFEEWIAFHVDISNTISSDNNFCKLLTITWDVKEDQDDRATKEELKFIVKMVRQKLIQSTTGVDDEFKLKKLFMTLCSVDKVRKIEYSCKI